MVKTYLTEHKESKAAHQDERAPMKHFALLNLLVLMVTSLGLAFIMARLPGRSALARAHPQQEPPEDVLVARRQSHLLETNPC